MNPPSALRLPHVHLCIVQPLGYVHSLGFTDQARYLRHQFRRFGAQVSMAKNRLRHDAVNFVLGAHLGFEASLRQRHACIFVNLEQLGAGGASVSPQYIELLRTSAVCDYDAANLSAYATHPEDVNLVPLLFAPYLATESAPLEQRPIDLLFYGSMNPRRQALMQRLEAMGVSVSTFDGPLYGPERDAYIQQAKAVLNMHFYESSRFEQARVSHCLSLGTPVIAERGPHTQVPAEFEDCVFWFDDAGLERFFRERFARPEFFEQARGMLQRFAQTDPLEPYADLLAFAAGFAGAHAQRRSAAPWVPSQIHLGSGKDYKPGWLNLDVLERAQPDLVLNLCEPLQLPVIKHSALAGAVQLSEGCAQTIWANNVLEHVSDLPTLMGNCLRLLAVGGCMEIEVPYEHAPSAWQDPTHVRALNENSWLYYTDWYWYLGWYEHRFVMQSLGYLDAQLKPCGKETAAFMRVQLVKHEASLRDRMNARTFSPDLMLPDDELHAATALEAPEPQALAAQPQPLMPA